MLLKILIKILWGKKEKNEKYKQNTNVIAQENAQVGRKDLSWAYKKEKLKRAK